MDEPVNSIKLINSKSKITEEIVSQFSQKVKWFVYLKSPWRIRPLGHINQKTTDSAYKKSWFHIFYYFTEYCSHPKTIKFFVESWMGYIRKDESERKCKKVVIYSLKSLCEGRDG